MGYDINCGVRLALVPLPFESISEENKREIIEKIYSLVPSGMGRGQSKKRGLADRDYRELASLGSSWSIERGYVDFLKIWTTQKAMGMHF